MFTIRPFNPDLETDYTALVQIHNEVWSDDLTSVYFVKRSDWERDPAHLYFRFMVELDDTTSEPGKAVAAGNCGHAHWAFHPQKFYLDGHVLPNYRSQGIGSALYAHLMETLRPYTPIQLDGWARADKPDGVRFLEKRGYTIGSIINNSKLDPAQFDNARFEPYIRSVRESGIRLITFREAKAEFPDLIRRLHAFDSEVAQDIPWHDDFTPMPYTQFEKSYTNNPDLLEDGYFLALDGDQIVGLTQLWGSQANDEVLYTGLTGVIRTYRRRGIATALKTLAILYAQGLTAKSGKVPGIKTDNEKDNPMYALNIDLGFKKMPENLAMVKKGDGLLDH